VSSDGGRTETEGTAIRRPGVRRSLGFGAAVAEISRLELVRLRRGGKLRLALGFAVVLPGIVAVGHHLAPEDAPEVAVADAAAGDAATDEAGDPGSPAEARGAAPGSDGDRRGAEAAADDDDEEDPLETGARWAFFSLLVFVFPFLFGVGAIAEEVERRSLPYLLARPLPRRAVALGKLAAAAGATVAFLLLGLAVMLLGLYGADLAALADALPSAARIAGALVVLGVTYAAFCVFWSAALPESAAVVAAAHLGLVELLFGMAPGALRLVSANHLARELAGLERGGLMGAQTPSIPDGVAAGLVLGAGLVAAALAIEIVRWSELRKAG